MKGLVHKVYCDMYQIDIRVCFCAETFSRKAGADISDANGCVLMGDIGPLVYISKSEDGCVNFSTCAHEAYHVVDFIMDEKGIEYQRESGNEHVAYFIGWMVNRILDCLELDNKSEGL
jgi:hypothetical protein